MTRTLAELRSEIQDLVDQEDDSFISESRWNSMISRSVKKLRDMLISAEQDKFIASTAHSISTTSGTSTYSLASNHYRTVAVDLVHGSYTYTVEPSNFRDRNKYQNEAVFIHSQEAAPHFTWVELNKELRLTPTPKSTYTVNVHYIPLCSGLDTDTDSTDSNMEEEYLDWVVYDVAIKARLKAEEPINELMTLKSQVEQDIKEAAEDRLTSRPQRGTDVSSRHHY